MRIHCNTGLATKQFNEFVSNVLAPNLKRSLNGEKWSKKQKPTEVSSATGGYNFISHAIWRCQESWLALGVVTPKAEKKLT